MSLLFNTKFWDFTCKRICIDKVSVVNTEVKNIFKAKICMSILFVDYLGYLFLICRDFNPSACDNYYPYLVRRRRRRTLIRVYHTKSTQDLAGLLIGCILFVCFCQGHVRLDFVLNYSGN